MPIVNIKLVDQAFDTEQKKKLISKVTDAVESVYPGLRDVTFVTLDEIRGGDWGIAGQPIDAEKVAEHARGNIDS